MTDLAFRRRLSRRVVRLQSRLEAGSGDRWIPFVIAAVLSTVLAAMSLARYRSLDTGLDLAGYSQAAWLISESFRPEASLFGDGVHVLEVHWSFVLYPLSALRFLGPLPETLLVVQSLFLGAAVVPLWRLARRVCKLRFGAAVALVLAYAIHPGLHALAINDFHPEALAIPGLFGLAYFAASRRWVWFWLTVAFVLCCRADLGLVVAAWGLLMVSDGVRRPGLWTAGVGAVWALGLLLVAQPVFGQTTGQQYGRYGNTLGEVLTGAVTDPGRFLGDLVDRSNVAVLVGLLAPVVFLPLLSLRHFLPAVPLGAIYLVTTVDDSSFSARTSMLLAFVFVSSAFALRRLGTMGVDRVFIEVRLLATVVAASVLSFIAASPTAPYERPWEWDERSATDEAVLEAVASLDPDDAVRASPSALAHLAERPWVHLLDPDQQPQVAVAVFRVRAVLIDERFLPELDVADRESQRDSFRAAMTQQGFEVRVDRPAEGVFLFYRP